jgi:hypothetical protein
MRNSRSAMAYLLEQLAYDASDLGDETRRDGAGGVVQRSVAPFRAATMREACSRKPRGKPGYENRASCEPVFPRRRNPSAARTASATLTSADSAATSVRSGSPSAFD